jgi:hypothetical protein
VIASNGREYLVCYLNGIQLVSQRLDENGTPLAPRTDLGIWDQPLILTSNGSGYLLIVGRDLGSSKPIRTVMLLDSAGVSQGIILTLTDRPKAVGVRNGSYEIVDMVGVYVSPFLYVQPVLHTISAAGGVTDQQLPTIKFTDSVFMTAALSPDAILIGWELIGPQQGGYLLAGYDGRTIRAQTPIADSRLSGSPTASAGLWDGHEFLMAFNSAYEAITATMAFRISADGSLLDSGPLPSPYQGNPFAFASADTVGIAVWPDRRFGGVDIVARTFTSFDSLLATRDQASLISWSGNAQTDVQATRSGDHQIAAWWDQTGDIRRDRILAYAGDIPIAIGPSGPLRYVFRPAVAASSSQFLIVWYEGDFYGALRVLAERVSFDGRDLDPSPIVLWTGTQSWELAKAATASDGTTFLVSWATDQIFTSRVAENGTVLNLSGFPIGPGSVGDFFRGDGPQAAWTGTGFFLGYSLIRSSVCDANCSPLAGIGGLPAGQPKPSMLFDAVDSDGAGDVQLAMAYGGGRVTFVWSPRGYGLGVAQTTTDGKPLTGPRNEFIFSRQFCVQNPAVAWDGAELVAAWIDQCSATVQAVRLNQFGDSIEPPFDVAANVLPHGPSLIPSPDGVTIVYDRPDEANSARRAHSDVRWPVYRKRRRGAEAPANDNDLSNCHAPFYCNAPHVRLGASRRFRSFRDGGRGPAWTGDRADANQTPRAGGLFTG